MNDQNNSGGQTFLQFIGALALIGAIIGLFIDYRVFLICGEILIICLVGLALIRLDVLTTKITLLYKKLIDSSGEQTNKGVSAMENVISENDKALMKKATDLIAAKEYGEARTILASLDNPTARGWIAWINERYS